MSVQSEQPFFVLDHKEFEINLQPFFFYSRTKRLKLLFQGTVLYHSVSEAHFEGSHEYPVNTVMFQDMLTKNSSML